MIPNWQWAILIFLIAGLAGVGIYSAPNSFAHLTLTGQCNAPPMPMACTTRASR